MRRTTLFLCILVAALGLVAAGCGQEQEQTATPETVQGEVTTTTESTETETTETETTGSESTETETTETTETGGGTPTGRPGRRQGDLPRRVGLHRLPHARGRGLVGHRRAESRRCDAELRPRLRPRDERPGRDALVRDEPH